MYFRFLKSISKELKLCKLKLIPENTDAKYSSISVCDTGLSSQIVRCIKFLLKCTAKERLLEVKTLFLSTNDFFRKYFIVLYLTTRSLHVPEYKMSKLFI